MLKNVGSTKLGVVVPENTHARCKAIAVATGQTMTSVMQMALSIGLSHLEPQIFGSAVNRQTESLEKLAGALEKVMTTE